MNLDFERRAFKAAHYFFVSRNGLETGWQWNGWDHMGLFKSEIVPLVQEMLSCGFQGEE